MTLVEFLLARYAEDEADTGRHWSKCAGPRGGQCTCTGALGVRNRRALAECEAKRRIVELHRPAERVGLAQDDEHYLMPNACATCGDEGYALTFPCLTLRALALPYADHPDYQQEWKA